MRWMDAPAPLDPRTKEQRLADEQVCRLYSKNTVKNFVKQQQFFDTMIRAQMEAVRVCISCKFLSVVLQSD